MWAWAPPVIGSGRFRAQSFGELLDSTFTVYRRRFLTIIGIAALCQVPYVALQYLGGRSALTTIQSLQGKSPATTAAAQRELSKLVGPGLTLVAITLAYYLLLLPLMEAATIHVVSHDYLDRPTSLSAALRGAARRFWSLAGYLLLQLAVAIAAPILLVVIVAVLGAAPVAVLLGFAGAGWMIYSLVKMTLGVPALVLETLSPVQALRRSWHLTRGSFWRLVLLYLVIGIASWILTGLVGGPVGLMVGAAGSVNALSAQILAGGLAGVLTSPFIPIALTLFYYDVRIRREAFDIAMLVQSF